MAKSFYIIDGHAQIFRAYFAPFRELKSPTGEPTKATYVFTQMLLNLIQQRKPDYIAMAIDASGDEAVFRRTIYPEYKAHRKPPPDDFAPQAQRILQIVRDSGVPIFGLEGFEADDLIATMVRRLRDRDVDLFLVSKDKDLRQVLGGRARMFDVQTSQVIDAAAMEAKFGYKPAQAIDVQTLMGDAVDNVPGIPGVGEKTAAKLIAQYGSVDGIYAHLDELTPKLRENFEKNRQIIPLSRSLVTLKDDVEFDFDLEKCAASVINYASLRRDMEALGFHGLVEKLPKGTAAPASAPVPAPPAQSSIPTSLFAAELVVRDIAATSGDHDYRLVDTSEKLKKFLEQLRKQKRFAFDTETTGIDPLQAELVGLSFSWKEGTGWYLAVKTPSGCPHLEAADVIKALKPILEDPKIGKVGHNIKYDLMVMRKAGVMLRGIVMDSMIAAFVLDAGRMQYGIDRLALDMLNFRKIATSELIGKGKQQITMDCVAVEQVCRYAAEDADIAWRLSERFSNELDALPELRKLADEVEFPLIDVLAEMEFNGVAVDPAVLKEQSRVLGERIEVLRDKIFEAAGGPFNPDSPKQLAGVLFDRLKLPTAKKTQTGFSTDVEVLEKLAEQHALPRLVLDYRGLVKLKNTYLDNLTDYVNPRTGRIHGSFNPAGAATGRLSMSDPNLQNIPIRTDEGRRIRLAFVAGAKGNVLLTADYSQIELRVLAHLTLEPGLLRAFRADEDVHRAVAAEVFKVKPEDVTREQRDSAKIINFGIIYGVGAHGLARRIEGLDHRGAAELIELYHQRFPGISKFTRDCVEQARRLGYVSTILGRRRPLPEINSGVFSIRSYAERAAVNSVVQGSAADLIKLAMLNIYRRMARDKSPSKMLLQVHDELVFETPLAKAEGEAEMIRKEMTGAMDLAVPLKVEVSWAENWQEVS